MLHTIDWKLTIVTYLIFFTVCLITALLLSFNRKSKEIYVDKIDNSKNKKLNYSNLSDLNLFTDFSIFEDITTGEIKIINNQKSTKRFEHNL